MESSHYACMSLCWYIQSFHTLLLITTVKYSTDRNSDTGEVSVRSTFWHDELTRWKPNAKMGKWEEYLLLYSGEQWIIKTSSEAERTTKLVSKSRIFFHLLFWLIRKQNHLGKCVRNNAGSFERGIFWHLESISIHIWFAISLKVKWTKLSHI